MRGETKLDDALRAIATRRPKLIDLSLGRTRAALGRLGDPQDRLPPTFHVAGTNGKGSTVAYIRSMLEAAGARVHVYTSPHLVRYNERITLAGSAISDEAFMAALAAVDHAAGSDELTYFETLTCAAFVAFAEVPADFVVLEVGLGGRLDATNVISEPAAAVITPIGLDHQSYLGDTLAAIAREKAGVFKAGRPAVIGAQEPEAMAALIDAAAAAQATPFVFGADWTNWAESGRLVYQDMKGLSDLDPPRIFGAHQFGNAGLAVAALRAGGLELSSDVLSRGISTAAWPARMQRIGGGRIGKLLRIGEAGAGREAWLDGGHNPHAAAAIARALADLSDRSPKPVFMIAGMQSTKDAQGYFTPFEGLVRQVVATAADAEHAASPDDIMNAAIHAGIAASKAPTLAAALSAAADIEAGPVRFLIAGSLYLAGEALAMQEAGD
ncbi:MAG: bifunctional folylpolyglutamate synthase/dihydrofolate synthase [Alphaproteobacteria bacterium]|nr:bifunctional folylpolyglutamate synthase/dihydrofolate synthase [Alphaproteobacteria bacterium]